MALKLSKNSAPAYDYFSEGDGTDPITTSVTLTGAGGTITSGTVTTYLVATSLNYTSITVQPVAEETGVNWQASLNGSVWAESVTPATMDARSADQVVSIYLRAIVTNDGSVPAGKKIAANVRVSAIGAP